MIIDASYCGIEKGVDVIGAVSISSNIGKDFGEICGIEHPLGVKITNDPEEVISNHDMASVGYMPDIIGYIMSFCKSHFSSMYFYFLNRKPFDKQSSSHLLWRMKVQLLQLFPF
jgi:hypothetical protein